MIDAEAPLAFCAGWLRPRVYVSTAVPRPPLATSELRAVLAHEQHHGALRDPLRLAVGRVLVHGAVLPARAAPAPRPLRRRRRDTRPTRRRSRPSDGASAPLASAMLAFGGDAGRRASSGSPPSASTSLLGHAPPSWRLPRLLLVAALATLARLVALVWRASGDAPRRRRRSTSRSPPRSPACSCSRSCRCSSASRPSSSASGLAPGRCTAGVDAAPLPVATTPHAGPSATLA